MTILKILFKLGALAPALVMLLACGAGGRKTSALDRLQPCHADQGPTDGYCGTLDVWEDRAAHSGRKIALKMVVLPALKQDAAADPVFFLAGGPGQGAAELAGALQQPWRSVQKTRDIVLVDQRGTGKSNPLECKSSADEEDRPDADEVMIQRLRACLASFGDKADVTKYTTEIAMDDLDEVRQYLGYTKINLYGGSYGTRAAMVYARRHADHTRAVVLDGVAPPDMRLPLYMARDGQRALDLLLRDCEQEAGCAKRFPDLRGRLERLLARLDAHPQRIHFRHPRTGLEKDLELKRLTLTSILYATLYVPARAALVPLLIEEAEKGNFSGFLAMGSSFDPLAENNAQGMHFSVVCSEDAPLVKPADIGPATAGTFLGRELADLRLKPCEFWPRAPMDAAFYAHAPSDLPALILSGDLDPVTPPSWGQEVAAQWKNGRNITVPATGHGTWAYGCVLKLIGQFFDQGSGANLDVSCVQRIKRPPFFLGPSGPDAMSGGAK